MVSLGFSDNCLSDVRQSNWKEINYEDSYISGNDKCLGSLGLLSNGAHWKIYQLSKMCKWLACIRILPNPEEPPLRKNHETPQRIPVQQKSQGSLTCLKLREGGSVDISFSQSPLNSCWVRSSNPFAQLQIAVAQFLPPEMLVMGTLSEESSVCVHVCDEPGYSRWNLMPCLPFTFRVLNL